MEKVPKLQHTVREQGHTKLYKPWQLGAGKDVVQETVLLARHVPI